MKVYAISDLHLSLTSDKPMDVFGGAWDNYWEEIKASWKQVEPDDIVLIAGDISWGMRLSDAEADIKEIGKLAGKKIIVRGNHDYWWQSYKKVTESLPDGMCALQNNAVKLGDYIICGTRGWTVTDEKGNAEDFKLYKRELIRLELALRDAVKLKAADEKLIVMTHYPPFNARYDSSEVTELLKRFGAGAAVYGHLHGKDCRADGLVLKDGIKYYLTSCDLLKNKLRLIEV